MKVKVLCLAILLLFFSSGITQATSYNDSNCVWCVLQYPYDFTADAVSPMIYAQIYVGGITDEHKSPSLILAEVGYGPYLSNPIDNDSDWTWATAVYNPSGYVASNDYEYMGAMLFTNPGTFSYTFRFSLDSGATWTTTDIDNNYNGIQVDQLGVATVLHGTGLPIPIPAAFWMFGGGLAGIAGFRRRIIKRTQL